ncbi:MAG: phosphohydrolase [Sulfurimonas sp. RIFCSPHIGHO2_12_FULL_36_9]|uniref:HD-GYP domain-containing protein n=1 Tax=Sulfurimonas sp. RIFCSPLOWO2_12_36_12 TaxID=1802253 RepID=UPI0008C8D5E6|nr:HD domain-containing phosphohydrolase [Sulfurimonas sp. RIFCSPLOWO2_12_36_12]OHD97735.1 MAG: phosphohydrolase [Sulfurimonas sp. RIFCSPLOWO2_02_FULL_36_28]OHD99600.1 MAG: phosphohydrolase [Sulfurimonas sp. RIFCSPHIGHO2_12_FULL_36_9]OHE01089.1 MAG: phosphohydrolase [Sulfurimonas sp. RIFCSPLOWO2_12_36_12]OHE07869.1 MAG: phosphohydrolase [Sulfurimonas sp. RIFCSPLOWO2_12_FULL_36_74]
MKIIKTKLNYANSYTLFDINTLAVGEVVLFDILIKKEDGYIIIIEAGTVLSENLYDKLKKQEGLYIAKKDEEKQILSCESLKYYIRHNKDNIQKRVQLLYDVNSQLFDIYLSNKDNKINLECVELIVKSIIYLIKYDEIFIRNTMPYFINENMLKNHSLHVAIYALTLGNALKFKDEQLLQLGTAALLHDVGFKKIDAAIINKETPLSPQENKLVQKHPLYSVEIIKQNHIHDPYIIAAVMHHHERYDGTGYPEGRTRKEISDFASILAICDVFDALTNSRPHRKNFTSFNALKMMMRDSEMINGFNQEYLHMALKLL